jgi:hypothetical protein
VLMVEFMQQGTTVTLQVYCKTLKKLRKAIQNKRRGMLTRGIALLHANALPHTATCTVAVSGQFEAPAAIPPRKPPVPIGWEAGWTPEPVWTL